MIHPRDSKRNYWFIDNSTSRILSIVVTYNAENWLFTALGSLRRSSVSTEVVVVDNASTDQTVALITEQYDDVVDRFYPMTKNLGFGGAHNYVFEHHDLEVYDYIFLLNQDASIEKFALEALLRVADRVPEYAILSPMHRYNKKRLDRGFQNYFERATAPVRKIKGCSVQEVDFVNAAIWLIRSEVVRTVGGFDPIHFHYGEDCTFINRSLYLGYSVAIVTNAVGCHYREQVSYGVSRKSLGYQLEVAGRVDLLNPSNSYWLSLHRVHTRFMKQILKTVIQKRFSEASTLITSWGKLIAAVPAIKRSRKTFLDRISSSVREHNKNKVTKN